MRAYNRKFMEEAMQQIDKDIVTCRRLQEHYRAEELVLEARKRDWRRKIADNYKKGGVKNG